MLFIYHTVEVRANYTLDLAEVVSIILLPFVNVEDREAWEAYSVEHQGWYSQGLALQGDVAKYQEDEEESIQIVKSTWPSPGPGNEIPHQIIRVNELGVETELGRGPYAPWWQNGKQKLHSCHKSHTLLCGKPFLIVSDLAIHMNVSLLSAPVMPIPGLVNYNTLSHPTRNPPIRAIMKTGKPLATEAWDYSGKRCYVDNIFLQD